MTETTRLLKGIMKTSGWTQEEVAEKMGVSFQTINAWVNGKSKPRQFMLDKIRRLYLAQDITDDTEPTFVTLVNVPKWLKVGDIVELEKDQDNDYDDEAISATVIDIDDGELDIYDSSDDEGTDPEPPESIKVWDNEISDCIEVDFMYVANSISTVVRGTSSAGRIYDKFNKKARARVLFIFHKTAIARIVEWNYEKLQKRC